jgi:hypothetical protein
VDDAECFVTVVDVTRMRLAGGKCSGGTTVTCAALDQCHVAGTCDPKTGCSNPVGNLGMACNDQATDRCCKAGLCIGTGIGQCL